jgi:putative inorganic carbon (HCO3(-)) transporter
VLAAGAAAAGARLLGPGLSVKVTGPTASKAASRGSASKKDEPSDFDTLRSGPLGGQAATWARRLLALSVVLYALQAGYSDDFSQALEILCFFLAPFAVLFVLLLEVRWSPALVRGVFAVAVVAALVFALVGFWQYGARELFWNDKVIAGNEVHSWFRVNSLFWDPNILGRYLAVTLIGLVAVVAWARRSSTALAAAGIAAILLVALGLTFSQSSMVALLAGLAVLVALRWSVRWTAVGLGVLAVAVAVAILAGAPGTDFGSDSIEAETSGRAGLISGGLELAGDRPLVGYGPGAFEATFRDQFGGGRGVSVTSHTEPITVAAEQGVIGLVVYVAFIVAALLALIGGSRSLLRGADSSRSLEGRGLATERWPAAGSWVLSGVRVALLAGFVAMIVHSLAYAAFLTDPITWAILAAGLALGREPA